MSKPKKLAASSPLPLRGWKPLLPWTVVAWRPSPLEPTGRTTLRATFPTYEKAVDRARELVAKGWDGAEVQEHV